MRKRALVIVMTVLLGFAGIASPVCRAAASDGTREQEDAGSEEEAGHKDKSIFEHGKEIGSDLYDKVDEKLDGVDKVSLRKEIREALEKMDEMGISPAAVARNLFGIRPAAGSSSGKKPGDTLIEDAQRTVRKKTDGFFTILWEGFLDTLGGMISTGISVFGGQSGKS